MAQEVKQQEAKQQETKQQVQVNGFRAFNAIIANDATSKYLKSVLGAKKDQFVNNIVALVSNSTALQNCEPYSVMYAGIKATALDLPLDPNLGFAYVIPYNSKGGPQKAQFQLGYRGFIQLGIRTGQFKNINVSDVREGELGTHDILTGEIAFNQVENREEKEVVGYVAYFKLLNGFEKMLYMTKAEMEAHAKHYSQTYGSKRDDIRGSSKWTTDFDAMAKKTVLKLLLSKWAPLSVQMAEAYKSDQAVITENGYEYVDNPEVADATEIVDNRKAEAGKMVINAGAQAPAPAPASTGEQKTLFEGPEY